MSNIKGANNSIGGGSDPPNREDAGRAKSVPYEPTWRSVAMLSPHQPVVSQPHALRSNVSVKGKSLQTPGLPEILWDVRRVHSVPVWYHLDRNYKVVTGFDVHVIAQEIVKVNKNMGVDAKYNSAKGTALLFTPDSVEIAINLFQEKKGIVVEVQRRDGDSVSFHKYCRCILLASSGELDHSQLLDTLKPDLPLPENFGTADNARIDPAKEALTVTAGLLCKEEYDALSLGMEGLVSMTDLTMSGSAVALLSSRAVLMENDDEAQSTIHKKILEILKHWNTEFSDASLQDHATFMVNRALLVLSNSLNVMCTKGSKQELQVIYKLLRQEGILLCLSQILDHVQVRPHDAMLSVKSLLILVKYSPEALYDASVDGLKSILEKANQYGRQRHSDLARTSGALLEVL